MARPPALARTPARTPVTRWKLLATAVAVGLPWSPPGARAAAPSVLLVDYARTTEGGLATNSALLVAFSEAMDPSTLTADTFLLDPPVPGTVRYDVPSRTAAFMPAALLAPWTSYSLRVTTGAKDAVGHSLASEFFMFLTTGAGPDESEPEAANPVPAGEEVPTNSAVQVHFSEAMDPAKVDAGTFQIEPATDGEVTYDPRSRTATFRPSTLSPDTDYRARVTSGMRDLAGAPLQAHVAWSFRTDTGPDTTAPRVVSIDPPPGSYTSSPVITVTFSETVDATSLNADTFRASCWSQEGAQVTGDRAELRCFFLSSAVTLTTGIRDLAGNPLATEVSWSYELPPPMDLDVGDFGLGTGAAGCFLQALAPLGGREFHS